MRVLVACECSGRVRRAFRALGHDAWSCDIKPAEDDGRYHILGNVVDHSVIKRGWDLMIAHPDCTFLTVSGNRWASIEWRRKARIWAKALVETLWSFPIEKIALENPVGVLSSTWCRPTQVIQPYWFGEPFQKATCLWLKNLSKLVPTNNLGSGKQECWLESPSPQRKANRSRTYLGIADAMASQWG